MQDCSSEFKLLPAPNTVSSAFCALFFLNVWTFQRATAFRSSRAEVPSELGAHIAQALKISGTRIAIFVSRGAP